MSAACCLPAIRAGRGTACKSVGLLNKRALLIVFYFPPVVGTSGYTSCTANESGCNRNDLPVPNAILAGQVASHYMYARVERTGSDFQPPPRVVETSIDKFTSATFSVTTTFDRTADGLGRQQVTEGVLVLVPKQ